jgi:hypothetical protein
LESIVIFTPSHVVLGDSGNFSPKFR